MSEVCASPTQAYPFDVGVSPDEEFKQFVVFGGAPVGTAVFTEEIDWIPYGLNYVPDGKLEIPPTFVILQPGGEAGGGRQLRTWAAQRRCARLPYGAADPITSQPAGSEFDVQVDESEVWQFLGDPTRGKR